MYKKDKVVFENNYLIKLKLRGKLFFCNGEILVVVCEKWKGII